MKTMSPAVSEEQRRIGAFDALAPHLDADLVEPWVLERLEADLPALI
jgi:hypothetical protein